MKCVVVKKSPLPQMNMVIRKSQKDRVRAAPFSPMLYVISVDAESDVVLSLLSFFAPKGIMPRWCGSPLMTKAATRMLTINTTIPRTRKELLQP
jgi:hypothetical protein